MLEPTDICICAPDTFQPMYSSRTGSAMNSVSGCRAIHLAPPTPAAVVFCLKWRSVARGARHSVRLRRFSASSACSCTCAIHNGIK